VVVTRPAGQAGPLIAALRAAGAAVLWFPSIAIRALPVPDRMPRADWLVFISANAVEHAGALLPAAAGTRIAAIGPATAAALGARGVAVDAAGADGRGAPALLADPRFVVSSGQRVCVIRGHGGREALADGLRTLGAMVEYLEVYTRELPAADDAPLRAAWDAGRLHAITVTSDTALANLHEMLGPAARAALLDTQVVGVSPRVLDLARTLGIRPPALVAADASDAALVAALTAWWGARSAT
jgi:uroporphyrinogen-III synthase